MNCPSCVSDYVIKNGFSKDGSGCSPPQAKIQM